jgi:hypothetical protein
VALDSSVLLSCRVVTSGVVVVVIDVVVVVVIVVVVMSVMLSVASVVSRDVLLVAASIWKMHGSNSNSKKKYKTPLKNPGRSIPVYIFKMSKEFEDYLSRAFRRPYPRPFLGFGI